MRSVQDSETLLRENPNRSEAGHQIVIVLVGGERPNLLQTLTQLVLNFGGNIEDSRMASLGGQIALIMLVRLGSSHNMEGLEQSLQALEQEGFTITVRPVVETGPREAPAYSYHVLSVKGADHEGIVNSYAELLSGMGVKISELDSRVSPSPLSGAPLFSMRAALQIPVDTAVEEIQERLSKVAEEHSVRVSLEPGH